MISEVRIASKSQRNPFTYYPSLPSIIRDAEMAEQQIFIVVYDAIEDGKNLKVEEP